VENQLTVKQAAERLGLSTGRIHALIRGGRLHAEKFGRDWMIAPTELERFAALPRQEGYPKGRPRKSQTQE
jgi:excisionase family DNA binding protein